MRRDTLDVLRCPRTGQPLKLTSFEAAGESVEHGLLASEGGTYPIVSGIPVFTAAGERAVPELRAGRPDRAVAEVFCASSAGSRRWRIATALSGTSAMRGTGRAIGAALGRGEVTAVADLLGRADVGVLEILGGAFLRGRDPMTDAHAYFQFRLGTPRHLVVLSVLEALPEPRGRVGDYGCGGGHLTWALAHRWPQAEVIAMDLDFRLLLVARHLVGPAPTLVCADITAAPIATGALDVSFSSDVLSYVPDKWAVLREMERTLGPDGTLAVTSVKDAAAGHVFAGLPLSVDGWRQLVAHLDHRVVADDLVLERYLDGKGMPSDDAEHGGSGRLVTLLAASNGLDLACDRDLGDWPHARGDLAINPLYRASEADASGSTTYRRVLPHGVYGQDNPELLGYLPEEMRLDADTLAGARRGERPTALHEWIASTAVLAAPEGYVPDRWPAPAVGSAKP